MKYPKCGSANPPGFRFCGECGAKLSGDLVAEIKVPKLEDMHTQLQSIIPNALAEKYLSAEQQTTHENRPITALFADISGFTPLSTNRSSEEMFQLVQNCFKRLVSIVAKYEGSISGFRGDGLLALFGAPILHENDAEIARKVTEATTDLFPNNADEVLPLLGRLLSIRFGNELDDILKFADPEQIRHRMLMRLKDFFDTLARQKPLLLILEDLHWADDLSLDLLSLLMDSLPTIPMMLVCVYRPEKEHRVWQLGSQSQRKCLDRYTEITLKQLSTRESRQLVEELLTIDNLPESVKEIILRKSEGNPFFIA